jgi:hypothetical protein
MSENLTPAQAEFLVTTLRKFLREIVEPVDTERLALVTALDALKHARPDLTPLIDAALAAAHANPALRKLMHQKYQVTLEKFLLQVRECALDWENLERTLRDLKLN